MWTYGKRAKQYINALQWSSETIYLDFLERENSVAYCIDLVIDWLVGYYGVGVVIDQSSESIHPSSLSLPP